MSGYSPSIAREATPLRATRLFQPRFRRTPLACLVQLALASSALSLGVWHNQAQAEPLRLAQAAPQATQNYNIPAGPLSTALARFASASGVLVAGAGDLAKGKTSPGVSGTLSPRAALDALLAGTDLTAVADTDGTYRLRQMPQVSGPSTGVTQLGAVTVRAQAANSLTEGTGSYTTRSMSTATRLNLSSRETPQSVSVITRQQLDDYNVNTLRDVMRYTPGMYVVESEGVADEYAFQARGFGVDNLMIDGQATDRTNFNMRTISADMNMYDRVEVLRGAAGLLYGVGAPSAAVNLVRKRPTVDPLLNLSVGVGTHDRYSATFDGGGAIGPTERVRGRLVGSYQKELGFVDVSKSNNRSLYGVVEVDLAERTTLGLGASYQRYRANGIYSGKPSYLDGSPVDMPRSAFWGQAWSHQYRETATYFLDLNHEFDSGWKAKLAAMHTTGETDSVYPNIQRIANDPNRFKFDSTGWDYDTRQTNLEGTLSGTFPLFGRDHELVVGASYRKEFSKAGNPWEGGGTYILDPHNFNPNQSPDSGMTPTTNPMLWANRSENTGVFSTLRVNLADSTKLILGGRLGWYEQQGTGWYFGQRNWRKAVRQNAEFTPFAGIVQDLDDKHSVYASYAQIFQPQGAVDVNGKQLDPMTGTNLEVGIKGEYFDGALNSNLALYQIKQRNRAVSDEENCPAGGPLSCSRAAGEIESKGIDVEISGALTPRWQVGGGYTFNLARYTKDSNAARIGQRLNNEVPRHLFKMFTNYRPGGEWHRWNVGASVYMQSPIEIDEGVFHAYQGTYAVVGLMAGYQVNSKMNLVLNVDNLFDRHYRTALGASWSGSGVRHGAPLNAMLRMEYQM